MSEWQPIETVPKDGTKVLLRFDKPFVDTTEDGVTVGVWIADRKYWFLTCVWASTGAHRDPVNWAPLPETPK